MLAIIVPIARIVVMALSTGAAVTVVQELVDGTFKKLVDAIQSEHGLTTEEAKDIFFNILVDLAINSATIGTVLRTKLAVRTAEWLGLTSKGFVKRKLSPRAIGVVGKIIGPWEKFKAFSLISKIVTAFGAVTGLVWVGVGIANAVEPGIYKAKEANNLWDKLIGVRPFPEQKITPQPGPFDAAQFRDYAAALESVGVKGFEYGFPIGTVLYSRETLADVIDFVYGQEVVKGNAPSAKQLIPFLSKYLISGSATVPLPSSAQANTSESGTAVPQTKVFTGVVSQGTIGSGLAFVARPDDLIQSMSELQDAINNNVAPYLAALLNKVTYEIKIVSSVIVKGLKITGKSQQIVSGHTKAGKAQYKTVVNKFAVANLFLSTDKGTRSKITSIILGPTDALRFQPTENQLVLQAQAVSGNIIATNPDAISKVVTSTPTAVVTPQEHAQAQVVTQPQQKYIGTMNSGTTYEGTGSTPQTFISDKEANGQAFGIELINLQASRIGSNTSTLIVSVAPKQLDQVTPAQALPATALTAQTLSEFYLALGKSLPTLTDRGILYQQLGLGQTAFYTGTAEQNTKLLQALKLQGV